MRYAYLSLLLFCINVFIFTAVYRYTSAKDGLHYTFGQALHMAVMMQTGTGGDFPKSASNTMVAVTIQTVIAYTITIGFIASVFHSITTHKRS